MPKLGVIRRLFFIYMLSFIFKLWQPVLGFSVTFQENSEYNFRNKIDKKPPWGFKRSYIFILLTVFAAVMFYLGLIMGYQIWLALSSHRTHLTPAWRKKIFFLHDTSKQLYSLVPSQALQSKRALFSDLQLSVVHYPPSSWDKTSFCTEKIYMHCVACLQTYWN